MDEVYEIDECVKWINRNYFKKIALQFSQNDLPDSPSVVKLLQEKTSCSHEYFVVLTASCGTDFLAPLRLGSNFIQGIICFGSGSQENGSSSACFNPNESYGQLPVFYCFGKKSCQDQDVINFVVNEIKKNSGNCLTLYDLSHSSLITRLIQSSDLDSNNVGKIIRSRRDWSFTESFEKTLLCEDNPSVVNRLGRFALPKPLDSYESILWVGDCQDLFFRVNSVKDITLINLKEMTTSVMRPQKELMKRLALIEKTKEAKTIGIIFTNVLPQVDSVLETTKKLIESKKKQYILISLIQAVDNSKFGNFGEVDVFVLVTACSCGSFILTTKAHVPLITLTELQVALGVKTVYGGLEWNHDQVMDEEEEEIESTDKASKTHMTSLMEYKANMRNHWFGLEVSAGETPVADIKQGATGVASGYDTEPL